MALARDFDLLHKYVTQHDMRALFSHIADGEENSVPRYHVTEDYDARDIASTGKEISYRHFLEFLCALAHFVIRNPYYATHDRLEKFIIGTFASRKKLPQKVYRNA